MDFSAFDTSKLNDYAKQAKEQWGSTKEYKEYESKSAGWSKDDQKAVLDGLMNIFVEFGKIKDSNPDSKEAASLVKKLQDYISKNFYTCTDEILLGLGKGYASGGEFTQNIDASGGAGTGKFACAAIEAYVNH